ncbi:hypothetical protein L873DRAFT_1786098 [Choiromyces venosus 120613-1]|uniref:Uncharacterized protein n=1 Tax=Choiromyces venosus 120613-1 TaxID=1336337 RepID=A0A3N4K301_9PEZI|nr:hypothetical protein L873DRAFT_1786098 [Choiromyces venosus 120613-1]
MRKFQTQDWYPTSSQPFLTHELIINTITFTQLEQQTLETLSILYQKQRKTETTSLALAMLVPYSYLHLHSQYIYMGVVVVVKIDKGHKEREATEVEEVAVAEAVTEVLVEAVDVGEEYRNRPQMTGAAGTVETSAIGNLNAESTSKNNKNSEMNK